MAGADQNGYAHAAQNGNGPLLSHLFWIPGTQKGPFVNKKSESKRTRHRGERKMTLKALPHLLHGDKGNCHPKKNIVFKKDDILFRKKGE